MNCGKIKHGGHIIKIILLFLSTLTTNWCLNSSPIAASTQDPFESVKSDLLDSVFQVLSPVLTEDASGQSLLEKSIGKAIAGEVEADDAFDTLIVLGKAIVEDDLVQTNQSIIVHHVTKPDLIPEVVISNVSATNNAGGTTLGETSIELSDFTKGIYTGKQTARVVYNDLCRSKTYEPHCKCISEASSSFGLGKDDNMVLWLIGEFLNDGNSTLQFLQSLSTCLPSTIDYKVFSQYTSVSPRSVKNLFQAIYDLLNTKNLRDIARIIDTETSEQTLKTNKTQNSNKKFLIIDVYSALLRAVADLDQGKLVPLRRLLASSVFKRGFGTVNTYFEDSLTDIPHALIATTHHLESNIFVTMFQKCFSDIIMRSLFMQNLDKVSQGDFGSIFPASSSDDNPFVVVTQFLAPVLPDITPDMDIEDITLEIESITQYFEGGPDGKGKCLSKAIKIKKKEHRVQKMANYKYKHSPLYVPEISIMSRSKFQRFVEPLHKTITDEANRREQMIKNEDDARKNMVNSYNDVLNSSPDYAVSDLWVIALMLIVAILIGLILYFY